VRIKREGKRISIRDQAAPFWALGLFLFAGGMLAIAMGLGLAGNASELEPWERLVSIGLGLGVSAGALWWLARSPGTKVQIDLTQRSMRLVRWGILGRQVRQLSFDQLESAEVEQSEDSDGGMVWRPAVRLRSTEVVLLSALWSHDERGVRAAVTTVAEVCRRPSS
jgi:hypothetical protein